MTFKPGEEENRALEKIQRCIAAVKVWMGQNWLKLNDDKTEFVVLGSPHFLKQVVTQHIVVGDQTIHRSQHVRNLGATFNSTVTMETQIIKTSQTAWYHLFTISKIRQYLTKEQSRAIIHAYVTSRLDQNNSLLIGVPATLLDKLQLIHNAAAKIILRGKKRDHVTPLLKELHWLPLSQRRFFKLLLLVFKSLHGIGPNYLREHLTLKTSKYDLRYDELKVPHTTYKRYGDRAFSVAGPRYWNTLPSDVQLCTTVPAFKTALKTHLFNYPFQNK